MATASERQMISSRAAITDYRLRLSVVKRRPIGNDSYKDYAIARRG